MEFELDWKAKRVVAVFRAPDGTEHRETLAFAEAEDKFDDVVAEIQEWRRHEFPELEWEEDE